MINAKNTAGMLRRNRYELAAVSRELGDADKIKALNMAQIMFEAAMYLERMIKQSQDLYPPKAKKKEKENA